MEKRIAQPAGKTPMGLDDPASGLLVRLAKKKQILYLKLSMIYTHSLHMR
jgi:hypothetical protein